MQPTAHRATVRIAGTDVVLETGRIARQAQGAVLARCGDNVVLATVTAASTAKPGQDFFPLTVEYREKFSAAAKRTAALESSSDTSRCFTSVYSTLSSSSPLDSLAAP